MRTPLLAFSLLAFSLLAATAACQTSTAVEPPQPSGAAIAEQEVAQAPTSQPSSMPTSQPTSQPATEAGEAPSAAAPVAVATPPASWVDGRVEDARTRLQASEAGRQLWAAIEAHGGLERWYANGPIRFRFAYTPVGGDRGPIDTRQLIDTWSSRAIHELPSNPAVRFGWDGASAWVSDADAELPANPRFWSLTPYYFVGLPWVLADPGVQVTADGEYDFEGVTYDVVRATFEGVGDAPDDYYRLLIHPDTGRVGGVIYVVSYPGFFPEGGHTPEKLMAFDGSQTVDGITLPTAYRTFRFDGEPGMHTLGDLVTNTTLTEVSFEPATPATAFDRPAGAVVREGYGSR